MHEHKSSMVNTGLEPTLYASQKPGLTIQLRIMNSQLIIITLYNMTDAEMEEVFVDFIYSFIVTSNYTCNFVNSICHNELLCPLCRSSFDVLNNYRSCMMSCVILDQVYHPSFLLVISTCNRPYIV